MAGTTIKVTTLLIKMTRRITILNTTKIITVNFINLITLINTISIINTTTQPIITSNSSTDRNIHKITTNIKIITNNQSRITTRILTKRSSIDKNKNTSLSTSTNKNNTSKNRNINQNKSISQSKKKRKKAGDKFSRKSLSKDFLRLIIMTEVSLIYLIRKISSKMKSSSGMEMMLFLERKNIKNMIIALNRLAVVAALEVIIKFHAKIIAKVPKLRKLEHLAQS